MKLSESIIKKIEENKIKPKPKFVFILKNSAFWILYVLSIFIGARSFELIIFGLRNVEWDFVSKAGTPKLIPLWQLFPLFWLIIFLFMIIAANLGLHHTYNGYKVRMRNIIIINIILSVILGLVFQGVFDSRRFENQIHKRLPIFNSFDLRREKAWHNPENGILSGTIIEVVKPRKIFILDDINHLRWEVDFSHSDLSKEVEIKKFSKIKMIGAIKEKGVFEAEIIFPLKNLK